jgi:hypothetical protein
VRQASGRGVLNPGQMSSLHPDKFTKKQNQRGRFPCQRVEVSGEPDGGAPLSWLRAAGWRALKLKVPGVGARAAGEARRRNIRFIAYNTLFLILPWVRVDHVASHILGRMAARISEDWQRMYGHPIYFLETFVDPERFRGTCYRAANWVLLGKTTGRGKQSNSYVPNRSIKEVLGYTADEAVSRTARGGRMKSAKRRRVDVNPDELDRVLDGARQAPLSEADCDIPRRAIVPVQRAP